MDKPRSGEQMLHPHSHDLSPFGKSDRVARRTPSVIYNAITRTGCETHRRQPSRSPSLPRASARRRGVHRHPDIPPCQRLHWPIPQHGQQCIMTSTL
ncbi:hypothetical protein Nepgr_033970 [Nepenthes gracilis]|uniref:Uncharacterized protein n=1 Tax=Nepenthes gracilis TaxID=150966 RepID=A0AAD3TMR9_NEPGR|nr:hypothetical protein Nepgr_033970 [Nepenthes gracilis]